MVTKYAEKMITAMKQQSSMLRKQMLKTCKNGGHKSRSDKCEIHCPKHGCFQDLEQEPVVFVCFEERHGKLVICERIKYKAW